MQPPYPMEESNQDRKRDAVIESITSHYSWIHYIEERYSTREKGRTKGRLLWFNWTLWTPYLISSHRRASCFQRSWKGLERHFGWERDCSRNRSSCGCSGWSETISRVLSGAGGSLDFLFSLCTQRVCILESEVGSPQSICIISTSWKPPLPTGRMTKNRFRHNLHYSVFLPKKLDSSFLNIKQSGYGE